MLSEIQDESWPAGHLSVLRNGLFSYLEMHIKSNKPMHPHEESRLAHKWFTSNQKHLRKEYGEETFLVCGPDQVLFHHAHVSACQEWVHDHNLWQKVHITLANDNPRADYFRLQQKRIKGQKGLGVTFQQKKMFAWFKQHEDELIAEYGKDTYVVCDLSGVLYAHPELSLCRQWTHEHRSYQEVIIRKAHVELPTRCIDYGMLPDGTVYGLGLKLHT